MRKISIDKIEDDMVLAKPIVGSAGNVLLGEGVVLKASMISRLKNWGIPSVTINHDGEDEKSDDNAKPMGGNSENLDIIFENVIKNPIMKVLYETTKKYMESK